MKVEQISIFIENKSGRLAEVARVLGEKGVNIRALSLADTSDFGILRLLVDNTDIAQTTLKENGFTVNKTEEFEAALKEALAHNGSSLLHLKTDISDIAAGKTLDQIQG